MTSPLFRPEALEHRKDRLFGEVILLNPISLSVLVGIVVLICSMVLGILFWGSYARKETVRGFLVPDKGIVKTYTQQPGTISQIHVREGDEVKIGQPLITMLTEHSMQGGSDVESLQLKENEAIQKQYLETIDNQKKVFVSQTANLKAQIQSLKTELEQIDQTIANQAKRVQIFQERVAATEKLLAKHHVSKIEFQKLNEELLVFKNDYQNLLRNKGNIQTNLSQKQVELEQLPFNHKARMAELENKISELKSNYINIKGHKSFEIRAPISGVVTALQARLGQWQLTNMPLLSLIPKDANLQAELYLPSRAIGFIKKGQIVRMRYDPFPYQRFGIYEGKISEISKHAILPQELTVPLETKEPVYRITVDLDNQMVKAYGKYIPLQAGMAVDADIILENRTLFQWILDPLLSLKGRF